jgi:hypothetical protein
MIWDITLHADGRLKTSLDDSAIHSGQLRPEDAVALRSVNGKHPSELVAQRASRERLQALVEGTAWRVDPIAKEVVRQAVASQLDSRAPLYPLTPRQRIGFLDEADSIHCTQDSNGFQAGQAYPIRTLQVAIRRLGTKLDLEGQPQSVEWHSQETAFVITNQAGQEKVFLDGRFRSAGVRVTLLPPGEQPGRDDELALLCRIDFTIEELCEHFTIPDVLDVARVNPEGYQRNVDLLKEIEELCL